MLFYTVIFIISAFFFYLASRDKKAINTYSVIAILIPSVVAGFRDLSVGIDTEQYYPIFKSISAQNSIWNVADVANTEWFYLILGYIGKYVGGYPFFLFICQLLTISFVYLFTFRLRKYVYLWLVMFLYFCYFYNFSLNIMRQFVGISYIMYISIYLLNGKTKKYFCLSLFSLVFHTSAIIGSVFLYLIYELNRVGKNNKRILIPIYIALLAVLYFSFQNLGPILSLIQVGRFSEYIYYLSGDGSISATDFVYRFLFVFILYLSIKYGILPSYINCFYGLLIITEMSLLLLGLYAHFTYRIALYLSIFHLIYLSMLCKSNRFTFLSKYVCVCIVLLMGYVYWTYLQVFVDNGTLPYTFMDYST